MIVKLLDCLGATDALAVVLSPIMSILGLPEWLGIVWAVTLLTNMFTGIIVFFSSLGETSLSVAQVTVLGTLMLIGHSIPVEGAVARRAGVPWRVTIVLRIGVAILLAGILHVTYTGFALLQHPARFIWRPEVVSDSLWAWALTQIESLAMVFFVILMMLLLLKTLHHLGLERLIHIGLFPLLQLLGIGRAAANVTVIGVVLGISYGAGLLIKDVDAGNMSRRESFLALCFLGLLHSIIEDTLLIMALGADLSGILWARLLMAILVIALLARLPLRYTPYA